MFRSPLITSLVLATVVAEHHAAMVDPFERVSFAALVEIAAFNHVKY